MRILILFLFAIRTLVAYELTFDEYANKTPLEEISAEGIELSSSGAWSVFTTPFSVFSTPMLLEPSQSDNNRPLTMRFASPQCSLRFIFATDGADSVIVDGYYSGAKIFSKSVAGEEKGGVYVGTFASDVMVEQVVIYTKERKRLLIDTIKTGACSLDRFALREGMVASYGFDDSKMQGVIGSAKNIDAKPLTLDVRSARSLSFWAKLREVQSGALIRFENKNDFVVKLEIDTDAKYKLAIVDWFFDNSIVEIDADTAWHHFAVTENASGMLRIYIDGILRKKMFCSPRAFRDSLYVTIGKDLRLDIDEVRLYDREISSADVQELFAMRENFRQSYAAGKAAGIAYCKNDPAMCGLRAGTTDKDLSIENDIAQLADKKFDFEWYLFKSENGNIYLVSGDFDDPSVWRFVLDTRAWKPVHNAPSTDGYDAQGRNFSKVIIGEDARSIYFIEDADSSLAQERDAASSF